MARSTSAAFNIVHDCDEIYNYWEPLHYLLYGYGMQTWEYRCLPPLLRNVIVLLHHNARFGLQNACAYVPAFMGSVVFCVGGYLPVLLDALFATTANAETVISHLISLDMAGMM